MMMPVLALAFLTSCSKKELQDAGLQLQPVYPEYSIAPITGRWEAFKKDELLTTGIPVNPPNRDTLIINADKTYTWKATWGVQQGTVRGTDNNRFELTRSDGLKSDYKYALNGTELKLDLLLGSLYLRKY